ncbi:MAG: DUF2339 domain-containing protein, partial [Sphingobacteriales bacterium]
IGIFTLVLGIGYFVKYAIDINLISPALRIVLAYLAAAVLFVISIRLRKKYELFSIILFSGAVAAAYFTTYAAFAYYAMLPRFLSFGIMLLLTLFTVYNALKYNRSEIAILGLVGAYAIPFFVRGNEADIAALLSYILLINLGVLALSFKKYWLSLNYVAFFSTWIIYFACIYSDADEKVFTGKLLLLGFVFFILFNLTSLGFKLIKKQAVELHDVFIISINTLLLYIALSILFIRMSEAPGDNLSLFFGLGLVASGITCMRLLKSQPYLSRNLLAMGIAALAVYVALHFEGFTITIIWVLMAIFLFVIGMLARLKILRIAAILLFAATIIKLLLMDSDGFSAVQRVIAYLFTGAVLLIVSFLYQKFKDIIFGIEEEG